MKLIKYVSDESLKIALRSNYKHGKFELCGLLN